MENLTSKSAVTGRVLIGAVFLMSGLSKLAAPAAIQGYIASTGLPFPLLSYIGALAVEIGFGALLVAGFKTRWTAAILSLFTIATAVLFHYNFSDQNTMTHFLKNIMILGGLLQIVAFGATSPSIDSRAVAQPRFN